MCYVFGCSFHYLSGLVIGWMLEEVRVRLNSAQVGFSLAGAGAEFGKHFKQTLQIKIVN